MNKLIDELLWWNVGGMTHGVDCWTQPLECQTSQFHFQHFHSLSSATDEWPAMNTAEISLELHVAKWQYLLRNQSAQGDHQHHFHFPPDNDIANSWLHYHDHIQWWTQPCWYLTSGYHSLQSWWWQVLFLVSDVPDSMWSWEYDNSWSRSVFTNTLVL